MKTFLKISAVALFIGLFSACINDDEGTVTPEPLPLQRGDIEVNRFIMSFTLKSGGGATQVFEFYDQDGSGGNAPLKNETWTLISGFSGGINNYNADIKFYLDAIEVTDQIEARGSNYIVCYRDMNTNNFRIGDSNFDDNGLKLGTETTWQVVSSGTGNVKISLNYIHLNKEGLCDAGVRIFETTINYQHQ